MKKKDIVSKREHQKK